MSLEPITDLSGLASYIAKASYWMQGGCGYIGMSSLQQQPNRDDGYGGAGSGSVSSDT